MPSQTITIAVASSNEQILATRDVMLQLRPSLPSEEYLPTVRRMMQADRYRLVALYEKGAVRAFAGFRYMEMLSAARFCMSMISTQTRHIVPAASERRCWIGSRLRPERMGALSCTWIPAYSENARIASIFERA
jgi:hypothetical protein